MERLLLAGQKDWRERMVRAGIVTLRGHNEILNAKNQWNLLPVSRCSAVKGNVTEGTPEQLYRGNQNVRFYQWCNRHRFRYGILSDLHGLIMDNETKPMYNTHPSQVADEQFSKLAVRARITMDHQGFRGFLYYSTPPITSAPYFYLMLLTKLKVFYIPKLPHLTRKGFGLI